MADTLDHAKSLGFVDDVMLLSTANDIHQLSSQIQTLSYWQMQWAKNHGAIFDTKKSYWVVYSPKEIPTPRTINFGDRKNLKPESSSKWLGVTFDKRLTFRKHCQDVLAKGQQRAGFLASLSHSQWGIQPRLMRTLLTTTVRTATDYGAAAWMGLEIPDYFAKQLSTIDYSCAQAALGALKSTPTIFLEHDIHLTKPKIRLQMKILNFIAKALTRPEKHPLHRFVSNARAKKVRCHHSVFHCFFGAA